MLQSIFMLPIMKDNMKFRELAKKLAVQYKLPKADRYDLFLREFDNQVEVLGWVQDPSQNMNDFRGREMLFPKRWVTIGVLPAETVVNV
jgi:hypothetical protein